ncbi:MAG: Amino acid/peptide transporter [Caulobacter sp.]|nr:Amino acid/peptide transporter [Caulobacter sp.]
MSETTTPALGKTLWGHPIGLTVLTATELWERFSYYGMMGLLTLYMTKQALLPGHVEYIIGFPGFRAAVEGVFGPLTTLALASQIFGLYTGFIYATPIVGGLIGDRVLGQRRTVILGTVLMAAGHLMMTFEPLFLFALLLLILGAGCIKGNMAVQVGALYDKDDTRRTRAFGIYLIGLNVGAFTAPLIVGTLGEKVGWHWGFGAAGIGMLISLVIYLVGQKHLPPDTLKAAPKTERGGTKAPKLRKGEGRLLAGLMLLLIPYILVFSAYQQAWNIMVLWEDSSVDRNLFGFQAPVTWFATLDGILTIVAVFLAVRLWAWQAKRGKEPGDIGKISIGMVLGTLSFLFIAGGAFLAGNGLTALVFPVLFFVAADLMIPFVDTVTMSAFSRSAPAALGTTMMGIFYLATFVTNVTVGWLGRFYETLSHAQFWLLHAGISAAGLVFLLVLGKPLTRMLEPIPDAPTADPPIEATLGASRG